MTISDLESIQGLDLYLLDQILKGRLSSELKVLDAGCGSGRNLITLHNLGFNVSGLDSDIEVIRDLKEGFPILRNKLFKASIEDFPSQEKYDYIIVNAVLHFSKSHKHFEELFCKLVSLLSSKGQLFIRMTSNLAVSTPFEVDSKGIAHLPDESYRYLLEGERLQSLLKNQKLRLVEPIKTVNVSDMRCMSTVILTQN